MSNEAGAGSSIARTHRSDGEAATRRIAAALAGDLVPGDVVLLHGDLGAGKTVFVKGLAEGLGLDPADVTSPTFTVVHEYRGGRLPLQHLDLYRLDRAELDELGLDAALADRGVVVVEWAERLERAIPSAWRVRLTDAGDDQRQIAIDRR